MRSDNSLILAALGQIDSDNENVQLVALKKARAMLAEKNLTFAQLFEAKLDLDDLRGAIERMTGPSKTERSEPKVNVEVFTENYLHENKIPFWKSSWKGKRVCRGQQPPPHVKGVLKILSDKAPYPSSPQFRCLTLSFETEDAVYHRYEMKTDSVEALNKIRKFSATGSSFHYV